MNPCSVPNSFTILPCPLSLLSKLLIVADAFDFTGFLLLAAFNGFVASRQQDILSTWFVPFIILTVCGATSLVSLVLALVGEGHEDNT